jgi:hypothetical protein
MCNEHESVGSGSNIDDDYYDTNVRDPECFIDEPNYEECIAEFFPDDSDSGPCQVGAYCQTDGETCNSVYNDPNNEVCQLTRELRCITNKWRGDLGPVAVFNSDPDCNFAPNSGAGGPGPTMNHDSGDASPDATTSPDDAASGTD